MANDRVEAIGRANMEADAAAAASMREEANRLLEEHRDRTAQLQEEMKVWQKIRTKYWCGTVLPVPRRSRVSSWKATIGCDRLSAEAS